MGDPPAPPQREKNPQPSKKRVNKPIGDSQAHPQRKNNTDQPAKKRVNKRLMADPSAPPQSEKSTQPTENRVNTLMIDQSAPPQSEENTQPAKKRVRGATRMKKLPLKRMDGQKIPIDFDQRTQQPLGENRKQFKSYVGSKARSKVSILGESWDFVPENVKDQIWEDIMVILFMIAKCNT